MNKLDKYFKKWAFHPAMLFNSRVKWWGDYGRRSKPHEGLDICLYQDVNDTIHFLGANAAVPVLFSGKVVRIHDDFIGQSVYVRHEQFQSDGRQLYSVYGHLRPLAGIAPGRIVSAHDLIGTLADPAKKKRTIPAHLHLTLARIPPDIGGETLDWDMLTDPGITLLDPLEVVCSRHIILEDAPLMSPPL